MTELNQPEAKFPPVEYLLRELGKMGVDQATLDLGVRRARLVAYQERQGRNFRYDVAAMVSSYPLTEEAGMAVDTEHGRLLDQATRQVLQTAPARGADVTSKDDPFAMMAVETAAFIQVMLSVEQERPLDTALLRAARPPGWSMEAWLVRAVREGYQKLFSYIPSKTLAQNLPDAEKVMQTLQRNRDTYPTLNPALRAAIIQPNILWLHESLEKTS